MLPCWHMEILVHMSCTADEQFGEGAGESIRLARLYSLVKARHILQILFKCEPPCMSMEALKIAMILAGTDFTEVLPLLFSLVLSVCAWACDLWQAAQACPGSSAPGYMENTTP